MWLLLPFRLFSRVAQRFRRERCTQTAAALSFVSLLGLVPMIAVGFAIISMLPPGAGLGDAIEKFLLSNLLPDKAGIVVAKYVGQFAGRVGRVTLLGVLALGVTAVMQMFTIEHIFNQIWHVKKVRPMFRRLAMHSLVITVGPLLLGGSLIVVALVASVSFGLINEPVWVSLFVTRSVLPFMFMAMLFSLLYWAVPNKPVSSLHAVFGGGLAALGLAGIQKLFTLFITGFTANTAIYGVFSAIPVFLVWLYASWIIVLLSALIVAELPGCARE
ncbi:YihY family inner membrane protein [Rugosibacter aromaticivorans]|uniref:YihY family inner membrane protein n=1 Tax=Rugosibacter aromaticivorans TaxID=1565605 RepID=UPI0011FC42E3|nr:YihY family inner membrane protein [Rugosibacter aromaticivorans]TBR16150.1 MAG: YihY family inner membrane protein [Rugosibacter sp.]